MATGDDVVQENDLSDQPAGETGDQYQVDKIQDAEAVAIGREARATVYHGYSFEEVLALYEELKSQYETAVWDGRIPYLGLKAYQEDDAQFFFGREELVEDLLERVQAVRFVVIAGPSGSGKSSVARAGLFHALRQGRVEGSEKWLLAAMSPKEKPIDALTQAVVRLTGVPATGKHISVEGLTNSMALHEQAEALLSDNPEQRLVLLVDQFEELFTQTTDGEEREAFIQLLTEAVGVGDGRVIVILALRSDFVSSCALYPELRAQINREKQFRLVGGMEPRDLAKAITLPSMEVGAEIEPALVKQIIDDMKGEPGALPLMSFALRDLFEAEKTKPGTPMDMTLQEYVDRGGIDEALERHADAVFESFTDEQKDLARGVFSKLITVGEGRLDTRRTAVFGDLVPAGEEVEAVAEVVRALAAEDVRLVTTSGERDGEDLTEMQGTVTIAHESLIDSWPWLRRLVDENRELIALTYQVQGDARRWEAEGDDGFLYRGGRLAQVEENLDELKPSLDTGSLRFIEASIRQRRLIRWGSASIIALLLLIFAGAAFAFSQQAARAQLQGERAMAQSLQANSRALMANEPDNQELAQARLLAVEGAKVNNQIGSPAEKAGSAGLLFSLAHEEPISYQDPQ